MPEIEQFDAIVIGSGQAGNPLAKALAKAGKRTAVIESKHVGGTCVNEGCTPTKTMVASGRVAYLARRGADYGVATGPITINMEKIRERKRAVVKSFREGSERAIKATDCDALIMGEASFAGPKLVRVQAKDGAERLIAAELIFINTGLRSSVPELEGIADVPYLDNASVMELGEVPEHLVVLGGGYIGLEFGQLFRRLGSRVTIVQSGTKLLGREDDDVAEEVRKILVQDGVGVLLNTKAYSVWKDDGGIAVAVSGSEGERTINGSHLLLAVGRVPNTDKLNPAAAGIELDERGYIRVDEFLETNVSGVYALGDVKGGPAFTHISYDDYRVAAANVLEGKRISIAGRMVPSTLFIDPELGRIGLTEAEARSQGLKVRIAKMPASSVARALETDESRGFLKIIVDAETDQILGAAILAVEGGEMASMIQIAMMGKLPFTALRDGIWSHPTWSEALNTVFFNFQH
ncbi:PF00070 family, FAD-dependent NAD(P)-disulfide oxidoreductase [Acidisarcina polymorpha]|uniref:PF00070 family, FAD-dependent NAD(P)-disulfide oxidoreductase n=1 Tax=Acidisarcina polymorpha TaxID=2211140 RepID=A0A2Z5G7I8_9BACT|nr:mercuric reductase [Acidisarcina polymorpha]AXC14940.1 PF00070 family, FAD-dependent NAD(P)-disulfide oxidoreductase [Acidisarcina polymorpha]